MRNHQFPKALSHATKIPEEIIRLNFYHKGDTVIEDKEIGYTLADVTLAMLQLGWSYVEIPTLPHYNQATPIPNWPNLFELTLSRKWFPNIVHLWLPRPRIYKLQVWESADSLYDLDLQLCVSGFTNDALPHFIGYLHEIS